jgi:hypothetical protein
MEDMNDIKIQPTTLIPLGWVLGGATTALGFIVASVLWASQIEAKADKALGYQEKFESGVERRLERIETKLDEALRK